MAARDYRHDTVAWFQHHLDIAFDLLRIYLGIGLFVRGLVFITDQTALFMWMFDHNRFQFMGTTIAHYVAMAHICGGALLALGLLTRFAALLQVPILIGAVFLVHLRTGLFTADQSLEFSGLVLLMLVLYGLFGAGRLSLDHLLLQRHGSRTVYGAAHG